MPQLDRDGTSIYYEEHGAGFPLLLIAPGGMNSTVEWWGRAAINPLDLYAGDFRLVAMDQRNAGRSVGPLDVEDPWGSFVDDQLALADHLGLDTFHVMGCCIGCSHALRLAQRAPGRVAAAVLQQPIGIVDDNRELFANMWREWGGQLAAGRPDIEPAALEAFGTRMWRGEFVLSVSREAVRSCGTPLLVLPGVDQFHPGEIGREVAALAPAAELVDPWKDTPELIGQASERVRRFLVEHTPA
ncbi:MAG TPA: alpha/beta hydrolase [Candidatus Dormibacteraeota bacterium]|nr:alpha/beta hydrolase [Candidatus Dormibacteraeota bacterium]